MRYWAVALMSADVQKVRRLQSKPWHFANRLPVQRRQTVANLQGFVSLPQGGEGGAPLRQQPLLLRFHGLQVRLRLRQRALESIQGTPDSLKLRNSGSPVCCVAL